MRLILGFFAKRRADASCVLAEAQWLVDKFEDARRRDFKFDPNPETTFKMF